MFLIGILIQLVCCFSLVSGLRCYNCKNLNSVSKCYFRTSCGQDESCSLSRYPDEYGVDIYSLGCLSKSVCEMIEGINKATYGRRTVASLTRRTVASLTRRTVASLTRRTVASLTQRTVASLTRRTVASLTRRTVASLTHCCNTDNCNMISQTPIYQPTLKSTERPTPPAPAIYSSSRTSTVPLYTTHYSMASTVKPCLDTGTQCTQKDFQRLVCGVQEFEPLCAKSCGLC